MTDPEKVSNDPNVNLLDHTRLIYPLRSASELVEMAIPENLFELKLSMWRPAWLRQVLKGVKDGKSHGIAFPDIHLAAICTDSLLKCAGAYHELKGHISTLSDYALPMVYCVVYHDRLFRSIWFENRASLETLVSTVSTTMHEKVTHELIADRVEMDVLRPYVDHRYYGGRAKKRIRFLEKLCAGRIWYCDMCGGPICTHRASMYVSSQFTKKLNLSTTEIGPMMFGIAQNYRVLTSRQGTYSTEGEITLPADNVLLQATSKLDELQQVKKDEFVNQLRFIIDRRLRVSKYSDFENLPGKYSIPTSNSSFVRDHSTLFESIMKMEETSRQEGGFPVECLELLRQPLSTLLAKSFIVASKDGMSLYLPKDILPEDERLRVLSLNALIDLKLLAVATYERVSPLVESNWTGCASRRGTQCHFKEHLELPNNTLHLDRIKSVLNSLRDDSEILSICKRIAEALMHLSKARRLRAQNQ